MCGGSLLVGMAFFYACAFGLEETAGKNDVIETAHVACFFVFLTVCFGGFNGITYIYPPRKRIRLNFQYVSHEKANDGPPVHCCGMASSFCHAGG